MRTAILSNARHVITPDGEGVLLGIDARPVGWGRGGATEPTPRAKVGFGPPVTVDRAKAIPGRVYKPDFVTYTFETVREYDLADVAPKPSTEPRESVEEFIARKSSPTWRPAPLPKPRKLPKLSDAKFAKLMLEQGATGSFG